MSAFSTNNNYILQIYSVVNGIASVRLIYENGNVNEELRQKAFASYCEESYASKVRACLYTEEDPSDSMLTEIFSLFRPTMRNVYMQSEPHELEI